MLVAVVSAQLVFNVLPCYTLAFPAMLILIPKQAVSGLNNRVAVVTKLGDSVTTSKCSSGVNEVDFCMRLKAAPHRST